MIKCNNMIIGVFEEGEYFVCKMMWVDFFCIEYWKIFENFVEFLWKVVNLYYFWFLFFLVVFF